MCEIWRKEEAKDKQAALKINQSPFYFFVVVFGVTPVAVDTTDLTERLTEKANQIKRNVKKETAGNIA